MQSRSTSQLFLADPATHSCKIACQHASLLVDACEYYQAFFERALHAQQSILLAGWQFNSQVELLRGQAARGSAYPTKLLPFLAALCQERPQLTVRILAWDYSPVFLLEREWLQSLVFEVDTPSNLRFSFDDHHAVGASLHQKVVTIDGSVAFLGGIDLACGRWDDCSHRADNPLRSEDGEPQKPYHDTMAELSGEVVKALECMFQRRWYVATGESLQPSRPSPRDWSASTRGRPIHANEVALSRTEHDVDAAGRITEVEALYQRAILQADRLVYIETQYLTAGSIHEVFVERIRNRSKPPLQLIVMLPEGADSPKELLVLGAAQERMLTAFREDAERYSSHFRVYNSLCDGTNATTATFIHSKLLIADDRLLCVGSANLTNRSLKLDSELCVAFEDERGDGELARSIASIRVALLAEHSGTAADAQLFRPEGLVERLDALAAAPTTRLRPRRIDSDLARAERMLHLERVFDPERPLTDVELTEVIDFGA